MSTAAKLIAQIDTTIPPREQVLHLQKIVRALLQESGAYGTTTATFTQPDIDKTVVVEVNSTGWMAVMQGVIISKKTAAGIISGAYQVQRIVDDTNVLLKRIEFLGSTPAGTVFPKSCRVTVGGVVGLVVNAGSGGGGTDDPDDDPNTDVDTDETNLQAQIDALTAYINEKLTALVKADAGLQLSIAQWELTLGTKVSDLIGAEIAKVMQAISLIDPSGDISSWASAMTALEAHVDSLKASMDVLYSSFAHISYKRILTPDNVDAATNLIHLPPEEVEVPDGQGSDTNTIFVNHQFLDDEEVFLETDGDVASALPDPLVANTNYFWNKTDSEHGYLSETLNGDPIDLTDDGAGVFKLIKAHFRQAGSEKIEELDAAYGQLNARLTEVKRVLVGAAGGKNFPYSAINTSTDIISLPRHGFSDGDYVQWQSTGSYPRMSATGIPLSIVINPNDVYIVDLSEMDAATARDSLRLKLAWHNEYDAGNDFRTTPPPVDLVTQGAGTHTLYQSNIGRSLARITLDLIAKIGEDDDAWVASISETMQTIVNRTADVEEAIAEVERKLVALGSNEDYDFSARIEVLERAKAELEQNYAILSTRLTALRNGTDGSALAATVNTLKQALIEGDKVTTRYTLLLNANGQIAGIQALAQGGAQPLVSSLDILASKFRIVDPNNLSEEAIQLMSVTGDSIILLPTMQSANWEDGISGWQLGTDGIFRGEDVVLRNPLIRFGEAAPSVSPPAGNFSGTLALSVAPASGKTIRYTLGGQAVTDTSPEWPKSGGLYTTLSLESTATLRVRAFNNGKMSDEFIGMYYKNVQQVAPVTWSARYNRSPQHNWIKYAFGLACPTAGATIYYLVIPGAYSDNGPFTPSECDAWVGATPYGGGEIILTGTHLPTSTWTIWHWAKKAGLQTSIPLRIHLTPNEVIYDNDL